MIRVSILGATGYAGAELARLLCMHKEIRFMHLISRSFAGKRLSEVYPGLDESLPVLEALDADTIAADSDVAFTSLPHGASKEVIPALYAKGLKVIDLSGDFRYDDADVYAKWYGEEHSAPELLKESVYGLPELHKDAIKSAKLVGNPGCYTTCSILALAPLVKNRLIDVSTIVIDAKSGTSGAGREPSQPLHFCEVNESVKAYKVAAHRHTSEIEQELSKLNGGEIMLSFTPHLLPVNRGILATSYAKLAKKASASELIALYKSFYANEPFVKIYESGLPELKHVNGSNNIAIGLAVDERLGRVIAVSCIDNLIKGAGGQAIQNMNLMFGLDEAEGLPKAAWYL